MARLVRHLCPALLLGFCLMTPPAALIAQQGDQTQQNQFSGSDLYQTYCAACHGTSARGDGPLADNMKKRPPDLTVFARQNGGVFPSERVYKIIDGRQPVTGHGGPDMPVWGDAFKASRLGSSEESVKARIEAIVKYLESVQQKTAQ
jgi:mono/diheme cytochrome c family protein